MLLSLGVYLINTSYAIKESVVFLYETICDSYTKKTWAFASRNSYPVSVSSKWGVDASISLQYDPSTNTFHKHAMSQRNLLDIVTAEITTINGKTFDLSSFFYSIRWFDIEPSLYELIILYFMHENLCMSTELLDTYTLTVLTSEAEEHVIPLNSLIAKRPFTGFESESEPDTGLKVD
jgi:hypothetical protein